MSAPYATHLTAAATGERVAWTLNERGLRNVWVAEGPVVNSLEPQPSPFAIWVAGVATGDARERWGSARALRGSVPTTHDGVNLH